MSRAAFALATLFLAACGSKQPDIPPSPTGVVRIAPRTGEDLVRAMHAAHAATWYRTLTFVQTTSFPGRPSQTWYEAGAIPGKLRIDIAPLDSMNMTMYSGDSAYVFRGGRRVAARKDRNLLMTLGFDVYGQDPDTTIRQLGEQDVDLSRLHQTTWQGRPVWVAGAVEGDTTSNQFWVDMDRLVFVRLIQQQRNPNQEDAPAARLDIEFNNYQRLAGGWIAPEVVIRVNGREVMREVYADMRADVSLPADLFDTETYRRPGWIVTHGP